MIKVGSIITSRMPSNFSVISQSEARVKVVELPEGENNHMALGEVVAVSPKVSNDFIGKRYFVNLLDFKELEEDGVDVLEEVIKQAERDIKQHTEEAARLHKVIWNARKEIVRLVNTGEV